MRFYKCGALISVCECISVWVSVLYVWVCTYIYTYNVDSRFSRLNWQIFTCAPETPRISIYKNLKEFKRHRRAVIRKYDFYKIYLLFPLLWCPLFAYYSSFLPIICMYSLSSLFLSNSFFISYPLFSSTSYTLFLRSLSDHIPRKNTRTFV